MSDIVVSLSHQPQQTNVALYGVRILTTVNLRAIRPTTRAQYHGCASRSDGGECQHAESDNR